MDRVKRVIHCDRAYKMGLNGKNITVAVMDTGIAPNELIDAIRNKNNITTTEFREKYRNNDVLLIEMCIRDSS